MRGIGPDFSEQQSIGSADVLKKEQRNPSQKAEAINHTRRLQCCFRFFNLTRGLSQDFPERGAQTDCTSKVQQETA